MPTSTYDLISSTTLNSSASSLTISSIPSTYRDLVLVIDVLGTSTSVNTLYARFNNDSGSNYTSNSLYGTSTNGVGSAANNTGQTEMNISDRSNAGFSDTRRALYVVNIFDYSQTKNKPCLQRANAVPGGEVVLQTHRWNNSATISSIVLTPYAGSFASTSVFSLYGIGV